MQGDRRDFLRITSKIAMGGAVVSTLPVLTKCTRAVFDVYNINKDLCIG